MDCHGASAASFTHCSDLSCPGRGRVAPAGRRPPQLLGRPAISSDLDGHRRSPGPSRLDALGRCGGRPDRAAVARRIPARNGVRLDRWLLVSLGGGHANTARAEAGMAASRKLGIATMPHRLSHGDDHRHCSDWWNRLAVSSARRYQDLHAPVDRAGRSLRNRTPMRLLGESVHRRQIKVSAAFCEQKAAKNFVTLGHAGFTATGPE
jgi:hypothetical protein